MENYTFTDVWERVRAITGWSKYTELAAFLGVHSSSITMPKKRNAFPIEWALRIAKSYQASTDWLLMGIGQQFISQRQLDKKENGNVDLEPISEQGPPDSTPSATNQSYIVPQVKNPDPGLFSYVPLINVHLSAGAGAFVPNENVIGYYAFRKSWLSRTTTGLKNLVLTMVTGNSMIPTLKEKDFVMVDTGQTRIADDLIYAIRVDDTVLVKRLRLKTGGKIKVISDNRDEYESYETTHDDLNVIGQVIWSCRSYLTGL